MTPHKHIGGAKVDARAKHKTENARSALAATKSVALTRKSDLADRNVLINLRKYS